VMEVSMLRIYQSASPANSQPRSTGLCPASSQTGSRCEGPQF